VQHIDACGDDDRGLPDLIARPGQRDNDDRDEEYPGEYQRRRIGGHGCPAGLVEAINTAQAERTAAHAELTNTPAPSAITEAEIYAMIDSLGDVGAALNSSKPESLAELYKATDLQVCYEPENSTAEVSIRVNSACVRGGLCPLTQLIGLILDYLQPEPPRPADVSSCPGHRTPANAH
jgi:hypothetical protein